jgi:pyrimidine deaminase RibD-like protein
LTIFDQMTVDLLRGAKAAHDDLRIRVHELANKYGIDPKHVQEKLVELHADKLILLSAYHESGAVKPLEAWPDEDYFFAYTSDGNYKRIRLLVRGAERLETLQTSASGNSDHTFARMAIDEARKSVPESDGRPHPKVGAVIVKNGGVLRVAHRGELPASHAEYIALEGKLSDEAVAGATVYTTLEPCTTRTHPKIPCAQRLIERKVARVVIGMLDPDERITGRGQRRLRAAGIVTDFFPSDLMAEVEELNREFTRHCEQESHTKDVPTSVQFQDGPDLLLQCHWPSPSGPAMPPAFHFVRNRSWELSAPGTGPLYNVQIQAIDFGEFRVYFEPVDCLTNEVVVRNPQISDLQTNTTIRTHDFETLITHGPTGCDLARFTTLDPLAVEIPVRVTYSDARGQKYAIDYVFKYDLYHEEGRMVRKSGITKR